MLADQTCEFKHRHFGFAKNGFEFGISKDVALGCRILQVVSLDVLPQLLDDLSSGKWVSAHDSGQFGAWLQGLHESGFFFGVVVMMLSTVVREGGV